MSLSVKGKLLSASGAAVPWVLSLRVSLHITALMTWTSEVRERRNCSFLNTQAHAQTQNPSLYSSQHSEERAGFSKPCSVRAGEQEEDGRHPEQWTVFYTFCICMNCLWKGSSVLSKEVGEPLFWSIMHLHFVRNRNDKMTKRKKWIKHVYTWDNILRTSNLYPEKKTHSFLWICLLFLLTLLSIPIISKLKN